MIYKCQHCGKEFTDKPSRNRLHCSRDCYTAARHPGDEPVEITAPCATCGKSITYYTSQKRGKNAYCSNACACVGERTRFSIECRWCGKSFDVTPSDYAEGRRLCSWACRVAEGDDAKKRICEVCGKTFYVNRPSRTTTTCSPKCTYETRKRGRYQDCETCGKPFWVTPCYFDISRFCSASCRAVWQSWRMTGDRHPGWNGGTANAPYPYEWTDELRAEIRKRDGDRCVECTSTENLSVHHIDYDKTHCAPENLITLCNSCHVKTNYNRVHWQTRYEDIIFHSHSA